MAAPSLSRALTVEEYLRSSFRPDVDFIEGRLEERNLGEFDHARIQVLLVAWLMGHEREWDIVICTPSGWNKPVDGILAVSGTAITIPLADIFAGLGGL